MPTLPTAARPGWLALLLVAYACGGDDAETSSDATAADDDGSSSGSATSPTDPTADDDGPATNDGSSDGTTANDTTANDTTAADTTAADTTAADTTAGDSTDGTSTDGGSDESSTGTSLCEPLDPEPLADVPLTGDGFCEGVPNNVVIEDEAALEAHYAEYCESAAFCMDPDPPCPDLPDVDFATERIVYVFGTGSGCNGFAEITDADDCGDAVEVHYIAGGQGDCDAIVNGWAAAVIPLGPTVEFIED